MVSLVIMSVVLFFAHMLNFLGYSEIATYLNVVLKNITSFHFFYTNELLSDFYVSILLILVKFIQTFD